ncbi:MAG TPA: GNAT family N-acetyltransferase [Solimonas sp.]|nr:GNAT family N-acetyltransferase [Solimonas sp.]
MTAGPAPVQIRRARPADAAALLALEQHFPGDRMSVRSLRHLLQVPSAALWVAQREGKVLGALVLLTRRNSGIARIYSVVVSPAARGAGLGRRLVLAAETHARRSKKSLMSLEVRADNAAAIALYLGLGYTQQRALAAYYDDGADGLRLRKTLSG